jgi:outer membrane lipoprotein-sorting protein
MKRLLFVAVVIFSTVNASAITVQDIVKEAENRYEKYKTEVKDITMNMKTTVKGDSGEISMDMKLIRKGDRYRIESKTGVPQKGKEPFLMTTTIIYDGKDTYMITPFTGATRISGEKAKQSEPEKDWYEYILKNAKLAGKEKVNGRIAYLIVNPEEGKPRFTKYWIDTESLLPLKAEEADSVVSVIFYSDYRKVKGKYKIPYKTEIYVNDKPVSTTVVKSLKINTGVSDEIFKVEAGKGTDLNKLMEQMKKLQGGKQ